MPDPDLIERLQSVTADAVATLRKIAAPRDWLDEVFAADGDALKSDEAAYIWDVHVDTARRRAEAAAATGKPVGLLMAGAVYLFSERRILDWTEHHHGLHARLAATTRAKKSREMRLLPDFSLKTPTAAVG